MISLVTLGWRWLANRWLGTIPAAILFSAHTAAITIRWRSNKGHCTNSNAYGDNACGSLQADLTLQPGESRELLVMLGIGDARSVGRRAVVEYGSLERAGTELQKLQDNWHARLGSLVVETPDEEMNHTINVWGLVQLPDHLRLVAGGQPGLQRRARWTGVPRLGPGHPWRGCRYP